MSAPEATAQLAAFVVDTGFADLPRDVVAKAQRHILDTFGAALAGATAGEARQAAAMLAPGSRGDAPVWGTRGMLSPRDAAFANGTAAHALELDDSGGCDHSGAVVLPAAIAALSATDRAVSGRELLTAVVLGYDIGRRVLEACGGYAPHNGAGWHSTATCGVFGAAATAARLIGLDAARCRSALGIAGSFSGGLWAFIHDASQVKRLHTGRAAEGGLLAALLAQRDISGPALLFADVWGGFFRAFAPQSAAPAALTAELGTQWKIRRCSIKPHASCRGTHSTVDAVRALTAELAIAPGGGAIERVEVRLSPFLMEMCGGSDLSTLSSAQMSLPYAIAAALTFGSAGLDSYRHDRRSDARIPAMLARIALAPDAAMASMEEPELTLVLADGRRATHRVTDPLGSPTNPVGEHGLAEKFATLAGTVMPDDQAGRLADLVGCLETLEDARALLPLLSGDAEARPVFR